MQIIDTHAHWFPQPWIDLLLKEGETNCATMGRDVGYAVSKAALNMITVKLAAQLRADGITAIALHPGYLRTEMGAANAPLGADEAAERIVDLIDGLTPADSGRFLRWDGTEHPW